MMQGQKVDLETSIGLAVKRAATTLNVAMDEALRPLDLTVSQYACLEQIAHRPEQSSAELARAVFVTRQSMNDVLRGLLARGLLSRPDTADHGRARPARLTPDGTALVERASRVVAGVEERMIAGLSATSRRTIRSQLDGFVTALRDGDRPSGTSPD